MQCKRKILPQTSILGRLIESATISSKIEGTVVQTERIIYILQIICQFWQISVKYITRGVSDVYSPIN